MKKLTYILTIAIVLLAFGGFDKSALAATFSYGMPNGPLGVVSTSNIYGGTYLTPWANAGTQCGDYMNFAWGSSPYGQTYTPNGSSNSYTYSPATSYNILIALDPYDSSYTLATVPGGSGGASGGTLYTASVQIPSVYYPSGHDYLVDNNYYPNYVNGGTSVTALKTDEGQGFLFEIQANNAYGTASAWTNGTGEGAYDFAYASGDCTPNDPQVTIAPPQMCQDNNAISINWQPETILPHGWGPSLDHSNNTPVVTLSGQTAVTGWKVYRVPAYAYGFGTPTLLASLGSSANSYGTSIPTAPAASSTGGPFEGWAFAVEGVSSVGQTPLSQILTSGSPPTTYAYSAYYYNLAYVASNNIYGPYSQYTFYSDNQACPPVSPSGLQAATSQECGGAVDLSWDTPMATSTSSDPDIYYLYRGTSVDDLMSNWNDYDAVASFYAPTSTFTDDSYYSWPAPDTDTTYYYMLDSENWDSGYDAGPSNVASAVSSDVCPVAPDQPTYLSAAPPAQSPYSGDFSTDSQCGNIVDLSWPVVSGATSYNIYRRDLTTYQFDLVASVPAPEGSDNVYYADDVSNVPDCYDFDTGTYTTECSSDYDYAGFNYAVTSVYDGLESNLTYQSTQYPYSDDQPSYCAAPPPPTPTWSDPQGVSTSDTCGGLEQLSWNASSGATGYNVYRSDDGGATYNKINPEEVEATSYTDSPGQGTFYYEVTAYNDGDSEESAPSDTESAQSSAACLLNCTDVGLSNGQSQTYYSIRTASPTQTCASNSQIRTCVDGTLNGNASYQYTSCSPAYQEF